MRLIARTSIATVISAVLLMWGSSPAYSSQPHGNDQPTPGTSVRAHSGGGGASVVVGRRVQVGGSLRAPAHHVASPVSCHLYAANPALLWLTAGIFVGSSDHLLKKLPTSTPKGTVVARFCDNTQTGAVTRAFATLGAKAPAPVITPQMLAQQATADLDVTVPKPATSPGLGHFQLVGLRTWLWVTDWAAVDQTAAIPGLSATVTARPIRSTWDFGTAGRIVCDGPGNPYDFSRAATAQASDCTLTFTRSGTYTAQVTVNWAVSWNPTTSAAGALPGVARTTTFPIEARAAQAVTD